MKKTGRIFAILSVLVLSVLSGCKHDDNTVSGTIKYKEALTGELKPAAKAKVYLMVSDEEYVSETVADENGNYTIYPAPDGEYWVEAEYEGLILLYSGKSEKFAVKGSDDVKMDLVLSALSNAITGVVYKGETEDEPVSDIKVYLYEAGKDSPIDSAVTDQNGEFDFIGMNDGKYDVEASYVDSNGDEWYDCACDVSVSSGALVEVKLHLATDTQKK